MAGKKGSEESLCYPPK